MIIHVVKSGDTIEKIAKEYGVTSSRVMIDNEISNPSKLVVGEAIVVLVPDVIYTVQPGDTLSIIADKNRVTVLEILRNNPYLLDRDYLYPGETIVIHYEGEKTGTIETNSYVYPFINMNVLKKTLPYLTYLTVLSYKVTAKGKISGVDDTEIIKVAKEYKTAPIMMLEASATTMEEEINVLNSILLSGEKQDKLINNLLSILNVKGYSGVNINTPYIRPENRGRYEKFIMKLYDVLSKAGYIVYNTFTIRIFPLLSGTIFNGINYSKLSQHADGFIMITYDFGYSEGIPPGTLSLESFRRFFDYTTNIIPAKKILEGISVIGYVWTYPYVPNESRGMAVSYNAAINMAGINDSEIKFDEITNIAYFQFITDQEYIVRFWDARSIDNFLKFIPEIGLNGISIWNIMVWFPQIWLVVNSEYHIAKVL